MKRIVTIILIFVLTIMLTACGYAPDDLIIAGSDINNMIEKATEEPVSNEAPNETEENDDIDFSTEEATLNNLLRELIEAPDKMTYEIQGKNGNLIIRINADVIIPNVSGMPVARVSRGQFSDDDINKLNKAFSDGEVAVDQNYSNLGAYAQYQRASTPNDPVELLLTQDDAQTIALDIMTKLELSDFVCSGKRVTSLNLFNAGFHVTSGDFFYIDEPIDPDDFDDRNDFENEVSLMYQRADRNIYEFMFTRVINEVPITFTDDVGISVPHASGLQPWMFERILIAIDDKDIYSFKWFSPYAIDEIITDASVMLPFSDIQDLIIGLMPILWDRYDNDERYSYEIDITEIRLGLMRITEENVGESGLIIPVWDMIGTHTYTGKQPDEPIPLDGITEDRRYSPYMTINAIDGSIIDRSLGY